MIDWTVEEPLIKLMSARYGVDFAFIKAIRSSENGSKGREFGVLSVSAPSYNDQLETACRSVAHQLERYASNPIVRNARGRATYNQGFIKAFADHWAPQNVSNDPDNLNSNWNINCKAFYLKYSV